MNIKKHIKLETAIYGFILVAMVSLILFLMHSQNDSFKMRSLNRRDWLYFSMIVTFYFIVYILLSRKYGELKRSIGFISVCISIISFIYYYLMAKTSASVGYQTTLSLFVSSLLICAGWWTQSTINRSAQRKSHTLNLITNQRFSDVFMSNNHDAVNAFGLDITVHPSWFDVSFKGMQAEKPRFKNIKFINDYEQYIKGVRGLSYLLNFYEFVAVGIIKGDLDSTMMRECFSGSVLRLEKRSFFLIRLSMEKDKKAYENFVTLLKMWNLDSLIEKYKENTTDTICNDSSFQQKFNISKGTDEFIIS